MTVRISDSAPAPFVPLSAERRSELSCWAEALRRLGLQTKAEAVEHLLALDAALAAGTPVDVSGAWQATLNFKGDAVPTEEHSFTIGQLVLILPAPADMEAGQARGER